MLFKNQKLIDIVKNKNVLFITTKNIDYIRNTQELRILRENASNVDVIYSDKKKYLFRIIEVLAKTTRRVVNQHDVVFIGFAPQLVIPFIYPIFRNKPVIIDFFISVYDTLVCDRKKFSSSSIFAKICHYLDDKTISRADYIISDTKAHASFFCQEFGANPEIVETLYLEADNEIYYPRIQDKKDAYKDKFVVLYFGSILPLQGVEIVLETVKLLNNRNDVFFEIIGPIPETYKKPIQDNVSYIDWLSQTDLAEHIANADLCLAGHFNSDIDKAKRTIPGKAYIYQNMMKPMILGDNEATHELFTEDESHYFVEMGSSSALSEKIIEVMGSYYG